MPKATRKQHSEFMESLAEIRENLSVLLCQVGSLEAEKLEGAESYLDAACEQLDNAMEELEGGRK